jgi:hypothetical protein
MNPTSALSSLQNSNPLLAILWAGFTCGTLDISAALVVYRYFGRPPMRLRQGIAAGVLGSRSFQGGLPTALLGLFCHFCHRIFCRHRLPYGEPLDTIPSGARRNLWCFYGVAVYFTALMNAENSRSAICICSLLVGSTERGFPTVCRQTSNRSSLDFEELLRDAKKGLEETRSPVPHSRTVAAMALTDGSAGVKLLLWNRKHVAAAFCSAVRSPYNKLTMEAGLWGIWALRPDAESVSYVLSTRWSSSNPPSAPSY